MANNVIFPRGSEWRKWDLHIHTKDTIKNDQFRSRSFNEFCITMFRKALDIEIAAIGITDYFHGLAGRNVAQPDFSTRRGILYQEGFGLTNGESRLR